MKKPKPGRPRIHTKGVGKLSLYLPKAAATKIRHLATSENLQLNEFIMKVVDFYETHSLTSDLQKVADDLGATLIKEE